MTIILRRAGEETEFPNDFGGLCELSKAVSNAIIGAADAGCQLLYLDIRRDGGHRVDGYAVHLCDSCKETFPECDAFADDVIWGDGKGNDNLCGCAMYNPIAMKEAKPCE